MWKDGLLNPRSKTPSKTPFCSIASTTETPTQNTLKRKYAFFPTTYVPNIFRSGQYSSPYAQNTLRCTCVSLKLSDIIKLKSVYNFIANFFNKRLHENPLKSFQSTRGVHTGCHSTYTCTIPRVVATAVGTTCSLQTVSSPRVNYLSVLSFTDLSVTAAAQCEVL